ncbi:MAG: type II secretion system F family protein [Methylophilaceae bacterium]
MKFELKVARGHDISWLGLDANDKPEAERQAHAQGYTVLAIRSKAGFSPLSGLRRPRFNIVLFSQELLALLDSGLSLIEAIEALAEKESRPETRRVLTRIMQSLYEGIPLSGSLEAFPDIFPALYVALIRSSEKTGDVVAALGRHVTYQSQIDALRKKLVTASIYPVLLMIVGGLVMLFLLGYVVPKFSTIYENTGTELPWASQMLLMWGRMLADNSMSIFVAFCIFVAAFVYTVTRPVVRGKLMELIWRIPAIGEPMRIYQLARFYRTLGMLLGGGIPMVTGMRMVAPLLQHNLRRQLDQVEQEVREGKPISQAMERHDMTTPVALRILRVGERTGRMGEMMERIGVFYDDEIARAVDWLTRLFEPILMVFIGLIIGVVVTLMYMPIFDLAGNIQ